MGPCDGWHTQSQGQLGGHPTPLNVCYLMRDRTRVDITQPHVIQNVRAGDIFVSRSGGGAGVGNPVERDPEAVRTDVRNELVSLQAAREVYKVVLDPRTLEIDEAATRAARGG